MSRNTGEECEEQGMGKSKGADQQHHGLLTGKGSGVWRLWGTLNCGGRSQLKSEEP